MNKSLKFLWLMFIAATPPMTLQAFSRANSYTKRIVFSNILDKQTIHASIPSIVGWSAGLGFSYYLARNNLVAEHNVTFATDCKDTAKTKPNKLFKKYIKSKEHGYRDSEFKKCYKGLDWLKYVKHESKNDHVVINTNVLITRDSIREPNLLVNFHIFNKELYIQDKKQQTDSVVSRAECHVEDHPEFCKIHIDSLYTHESKRGKGYATQLLQSIEDDARNAGCSLMELQSVPRARPLYERNGFKAYGQVGPNVLMRKELY